MQYAIICKKLRSIKISYKENTPLDKKWMMNQSGKLFQDQIGEGGNILVFFLSFHKF
jgi:hypothetical protein